MRPPHVVVHRTQNRKLKSTSCQVAVEEIALEPGTISPPLSACDSSERVRASSPVVPQCRRLSHCWNECVLSPHHLAFTVTLSNVCLEIFFFLTVSIHRKLKFLTLFPVGFVLAAVSAGNIKPGLHSPRRHQTFRTRMTYLCQSKQMWRACFRHVQDAANQNPIFRP